MSKNNGAELQLSKKGSKMHYRRLATPYLLLAPMLAFVMCFMIWPIINVFMMSTESYKVTKPNDRHFIGLENFVTVFTKDQIFLKTLGNTAVYVILSVVFQTVLGFWLAWLLTRKFKGRGVIRALALVPWAVAGLMVGIIWNLMLGQTYGVINDLLRRAGIIEMNISWFSNGSSAMLAAVVSPTTPMRPAMTARDFTGKAPLAVRATEVCLPASRFSSKFSGIVITAAACSVL